MTLRFFFSNTKVSIPWLLVHYKDSYDFKSQCFTIVKPNALYSAIQFAARQKAGIASPVGQGDRAGGGRLAIIRYELSI